MSPRAVVIAGIGFEDTAKVSFAEHDNMIEAVLADGTDQPLRIRVLPGRSRRGGAIANAHGLQPPTHGMAIGRIAVSDQVTRGLIPREGVTDLPRDPLRNPYRYKLPPLMAQDRQGQEEPKAERGHDQEVPCRDPR